MELIMLVFIEPFFSLQWVGGGGGLSVKYLDIFVWNIWVLIWLIKKGQMELLQGLF